MPELTIALPGQVTRRVPLIGAFTIGRGSASDLILKDARVSRGHALLRPLGRAIVVSEEIKAAAGGEYAYPA